MSRVFVHHIIVFEEVFPDVEVVGLHLLLGVLDGSGDQVVLNGLALLHAQPTHDRSNPVRAEDPEEIVFQGKIKTGTARIPLPAGTAPELVVDSPALMPLRSQDVKSAQVHHPIAEHDVRASSGHVGGDGHGFRLTGLGHDFRFLLMVLGIENGVGNPCPCQASCSASRTFSMVIVPTRTGCPLS